MDKSYSYLEYNVDRLDCIEAFLSVFESGSFSAAAKRMGTTQSTVSKRIAMLEETFGTSLFLRTTRRLAPTEDARRIHDKARTILDVYSLARAAARNVHPVPSGLLVVSAPASMCRHVLMPIIGEFQRQYPEVDLDIRLSEHQVNLVEEGVQLAVRIGELKDSSLRARSLGRVSRYAVASPRYFGSRARPHDPADLDRHICIGHSRFGNPTTWIFEGEQGRHAIKVACNVMFDDTDALQAAVREGMGIGILPGWLVLPLVKSGELEIVLSDYTVPSQPLNAVYPDPGILSLGGRAFLDFLAARKNLIGLS